MAVIDVFVMLNDFYAGFSVAVQVPRQSEQVLMQKQIEHTTAAER